MGCLIQVSHELPFVWRGGGGVFLWLPSVYHRLQIPLMLPCLCSGELFTKGIFLSICTLRFKSFLSVPISQRNLSQHQPDCCYSFCTWCLWKPRRYSPFSFSFSFRRHCVSGSQEQAVSMILLSPRIKYFLPPAIMGLDWYLRATGRMSLPLRRLKERVWSSLVQKKSE